jgi:hypothetical protein
MDLMNAELARVMIEARLAEADERRLADQFRKANRADRRRQRRLARHARRQRRAQRRAESPKRTLTAVAPAAQSGPSVEVARILDAAAHRVSEFGTASEPGLFQALAVVASPMAPGAAAALVDESGTEISRLRAFGLVHALVVEELGPLEHARLLDLIGGLGDDASPGRVA